MDNLQMYFNPDVARDFAKNEQNEKNFRVADIIDQVAMKATWVIMHEFKVCELGWWAHPDRYDRLFKTLVSGHATVDWVDISPYMLDLAQEYIDREEYRSRREIINFIESDIMTYLEWEADRSVDLAIMKYTIDHMPDIDALFCSLEQKLKKGGSLVANIWVLNPNLTSISTNARFLHNGEEFPENETRLLQDGDTFTVKFFKESGKPESGYIPGAETTKYYHSEETYRKAAEKYGFDLYLGDWKEYVKNEWEDMRQDILVLTK